MKSLDLPKLGKMHTQNSFNLPALHLLPPSTLPRTCLHVKTFFGSIQNSPHPLSYYLRELGFPRDRLGEREAYVLQWLEDNCPFPSGRSKRYFVGTSQMMYGAYLSWTLSNNLPSVSSSTFSEIRLLEHVGLIKGDIFLNSDRVHLAVLQKELQTLENSQPLSLKLLQSRQDLPHCKTLLTGLTNENWPIASATWPSSTSPTPWSSPVISPPQTHPLKMSL